MACDSRSSWSAVLLDFLDEGTAKGPNRKVKFSSPKNPHPDPPNLFYSRGVLGSSKERHFSGVRILRDPYGQQPSTSPTSGAGYFWIPWFLGSWGFLAPRSAPTLRLLTPLKNGVEDQVQNPFQMKGPRRES